MTELNPELSAGRGQDEKVFWDAFFRHLDTLRAIGIEIDRDKVVEIAEKKNVESAKHLLFYSIFHSQPTESNIGNFKEAIDFLIECGYIDPDNDNDPSMET